MQRLVQLVPLPGGNRHLESRCGEADRHVARPPTVQQRGRGSLGGGPSGLRVPSMELRPYEGQQGPGGVIGAMGGLQRRDGVRQGLQPLVEGPRGSTATSPGSRPRTPLLARRRPTRRSRGRVATAGRPGRCGRAPVRAGPGRPARRRAPATGPSSSAARTAASKEARISESAEDALAVDRDEPVQPGGPGGVGGLVRGPGDQRQGGLRRLRRRRAVARGTTLLGEPLEQLGTAGPQRGGVARGVDSLSRRRRLLGGDQGVELQRAGVVRGGHVRRDDGRRLGRADGGRQRQVEPAGLGPVLREHAEQATVLVARPGSDPPLHRPGARAVQPATLDREHPVADGVTDEEVPERRSCHRPRHPPAGRWTPARAGRPAGSVRRGRPARAAPRAVRPARGPPRRARWPGRAGTAARAVRPATSARRHRPPPRRAHRDQLLEEEGAPLGARHDVGRGDGVEADPRRRGEVAHEHRRVSGSERRRGSPSSPAGEARSTAPPTGCPPRGRCDPRPGAPSRRRRRREVAGRRAGSASRTWSRPPGAGPRARPQGAYGGEPAHVPRQQVGRAPVGADPRAAVEVGDEHRQVGKCGAGRSHRGLDSVGAHGLAQRIRPGEERSRRTARDSRAAAEHAVALGWRQAADQPGLAHPRVAEHQDECGPAAVQPGPNRVGPGGRPPGRGRRAAHCVLPPVTPPDARPGGGIRGLTGHGRGRRWTAEAARGVAGAGAPGVSAAPARADRGSRRPSPGRGRRDAARAGEPAPDGRRPAARRAPPW